MTTLLGILVLIGAIGCVIVVGIAMIPFFIGFLLTMLVTSGWEHFVGTKIALFSEPFWWVYALCTVLCFAIMHSGKKK